MAEDAVVDDVASLIAAKRADVAARAVGDLGTASAEDLPQVLHRLAGKLATFGYAEAGVEAKRLLADLRDTPALPDVGRRVAAVVALLEAGA